MGSALGVTTRSRFRLGGVYQDLYSDGNAHLHLHELGDVHLNSNANVNANEHFNADEYVHPNCHLNADRNRNERRGGYGNLHCYPHALQGMGRASMHGGLA